MRFFLNPLNKTLDLSGSSPLRLLNDAGIQSAIDFGLISITPPLESSKDSKRVQPASLDVKIKDVDEVDPLTGDFFNSASVGRPYQHFLSGEAILRSGYVSTINLTELINFGQLSSSSGQAKFFGVRAELRSSVRRLGCFMANSGAYFFSGPDCSTLEIGNFSCNDLHFSPGERLAQLFFTVKPFADERLAELDSTKPKIDSLGERVRALPMGVEITISHYLNYLQQSEYMVVSPRLTTRQGKITVHASSTAYRMKKIAGGLDFSDRDKYAKEDLLEPINISRGYTVKPFEHVIIETLEQLELSEHVGILFWDNLANVVVENSGGRYAPVDRPDRIISNVGLLGLTDGWVDPGYSGGFSRQPKWLTGRTIYPGDVVGYGQVFFFPSGVNRSYGSASLGSQYKGRIQTTFSK